MKNKFVFKSRYRKLRNMFTVHNLWGRTFNKHHQECAVAYADDAYIKILVKGISAADFPSADAFIQMLLSSIV